MNKIAIVLGAVILLPSTAFAQNAELPTTVNRSVRSFDEVADECFQFADYRSEWAASQAPDYDGDSIGGAIGSGLSLNIERKRLRKKIYASCMEGNGFPNAKMVKSKPKS
ncbi:MULTISPECIES: hypothetical protein [unclassified Sphingobium]|uniref:hypothetical protein n=1 Tax=unclassified Sphingobium TaxID=2611147 RepID=UPI0011A903B2|nr:MULTISPECIES: hypothetical protein [unclassified Sphingobium]NML89363.1 hypothetical protein [Sphingobium sp. TB-6]